MHRAVLGLVVAVCLLAEGGNALAEQPSATPPKRGAGELTVLGEIPTFSAIDHEGRTLSNADLLGHVWVGNFIFTQCTTSCPILSARMALLQRAVPAPRVRFVSFSVDPEHDSPAVLNAYAQRWRRDARWRLLHASKQTLATLIRSLGFTLERNDDPDDPITHTNGYVLVDSSGLVRGVYSSEDAAQLKKLEVDLRRLASSRERTPATRDGAQLFTELGCGGCHGDAKLATPLANLFGAVVRLADGTTVMADEAYVRESILNPGAKLVRGYPASMPSYQGIVTGSQLTSLVEYVKSLTPVAKATQKTAPDTERELVIDPVCKMEISAGPDTLHVVRGGKTFYFCSHSCQRRFAAERAH